MKFASKIAAAAILSVGALAFTAGTASARIVCNDEGDCWHTHAEYDYPPAVHLEVHPDNWKWREGEKRAWREHEGEGHGYWHQGVWVGL